MATKNKEILNQIRDNASMGYADVIPEADGKNDIEILRAITEYPTARNEFINTLVNKIVKTEFFNRAYKNPLEFLQKGTIPFGTSIEQIFVGMAKKKNFTENFGTSSVDSLIGKEDADVKVNYISKNFGYKWKVTVSEAMLRGAFTNSEGLTNLVNNLIESAYRNMYFTRYEDMKGILLRDGTVKSNGTLSNGLLGDINSLDASKRTMVVDVDSTDITSLAEKIRTYVDRLRFMSNKYNLNGVYTHSLPQDLVFFTTPEIKAKLDVNVLAFAFNIDKAEVPSRIILLDELGKVKGVTDSSNAETTQEVLGILADKDLIQYYTTLEDSRNFENGDTLSYNIFLHNQGICAKADFVNSIVLRAK